MHNSSLHSFYEISDYLAPPYQSRKELRNCLSNPNRQRSIIDYTQHFETENIESRMEVNADKAKIVELETKERNMQAQIECLERCIKEQEERIGELQGEIIREKKQKANLNYYQCGAMQILPKHHQSYEVSVQTDVGELFVVEQKKQCSNMQDIFHKIDTLKGRKGKYSNNKMQKGDNNYNQTQKRENNSNVENIRENKRTWELETMQIKTHILNAGKENCKQMANIWQGEFCEQELELQPVLEEKLEEMLARFLD